MTGFPLALTQNPYFQFLIITSEYTRTQGPTKQVELSPNSTTGKAVCIYSRLLHYYVTLTVHFSIFFLTYSVLLMAVFGWLPDMLTIKWQQVQVWHADKIKICHLTELSCFSYIYKLQDGSPQLDISQ